MSNLISAAPRCNCGGTLAYDPKTASLVCRTCGAHRDVIDSSAPVRVPIKSEADISQLAEQGSHDWELPLTKLACADCGKTVLALGDAPKACPICGSERITSAPDAPLKPTAVCPFQLTPGEAAEKLAAYLKKQHFLPGDVRKLTAPGMLKPVYLPGYTFNAETVSTYKTEFGVDRSEKDRYNRMRTVTDWYPVSGTYTEDATDHLIWCAEGVETEVLEGLQPYLTDDCRAYRPEYLMGSAILPAGETIFAAWKRARRTLEKSIAEHIRFEILSAKNAHHTKAINPDTVYTQLSCQSLLLPAYVAYYIRGKKQYPFFINGETGEVSCKKPLSPFRVGLVVAAIAAAFLLLMLWMKLS